MNPYNAGFPSFSTNLLGDPAKSNDPCSSVLQVTLFIPSQFEIEAVPSTDMEQGFFTVLFSIPVVASRQNQSS